MELLFGFFDIFFPKMYNYIFHIINGHILDLILSPSDQDTTVDVKNCDFVSDDALVKCSIAFPRQVAHIPNKVQYRRHHCINMSDFR